MLTDLIIFIGFVHTSALSDRTIRPNRHHVSWVRKVIDDLFIDDLVPSSVSMSGWARAKAFNKCKETYYGRHDHICPLVDNTAHAVYFLESKAGSSTVRNSIKYDNHANHFPTNHNNKYTRFTFVRDPASRLVSAFLYKHMFCTEGEKKNLTKDKIFHQKWTPELRDQVLGWFEEYVFTLEKTQKSRTRCWDSHVTAQRGRLPDPTEYPMDFIGDLASIEHDWVELQKYQQKNFQAPLGDLQIAPLMHAPNSATNLLNVSLVPDHVMAKICTMFRDDFCCFKFPFPKACNLQCEN